MGLRFFANKAAYLIASLGFSMPVKVFSTLKTAYSSRVTPDYQAAKLVPVLHAIFHSLHLHSQRLNMDALQWSQLLVGSSIPSDVKASLFGIGLTVSIPTLQHDLEVMGPAFRSFCTQV